VQIIIVGGGLVGTTLAEKLSHDGHDVSLVEHDAKGAAELAAALDVRIVEGNGATANTLRRAGAADASLVVATTDSDEVNFVTGRIAASMFKVPRVVVRLRDPDHDEAFQELSRGDAVEIFCVNPEAAAVEKIASLLEVPSALDVVSFMDGELLVAGFRITESSEFAERPVSDMDLFFAETPSLVAAIQRGDHTVVPHGDEEIHAGDIVYFAIRHRTKRPRGRARADGRTSEDASPRDDRRSQQDRSGAGASPGEEREPGLIDRARRRSRPPGGRFPGRHPGHLRPGHQ
jgi:trk system potassium uptake protein TrkA